jgi:hypothetical protein
MEQLPRGPSRLLFCACSIIVCVMCTEDNNCRDCWRLDVSARVIESLLGCWSGKHNPQTGSWANSETEVSHWVQAPRAFCSSTHVEENASREGCFLLMSLPSHSGFMYADDWCFFNDFMSVLASTWKKWYNLCNACADNWGKLWKMKIEDGSQFLCRLHYLPKLSLRSLVDGLTSPVELSAVLLSELQQR